MSKGNLFLGMARGKVGDVVFSRVGGEQVARARNRSPKNPQTPLQLLQRVIAKTVSIAYSSMIDIVDHSFQGLKEGTPNQSRFFALNVQAMRERLAAIINSGNPEAIVTSNDANFNSSSQSLPLLNAWQISEGHLPGVGLVYTPAAEGAQGGSFFIPGITAASATPTYAEVVASLGLQRGDQLTFCIVGNDDVTLQADPSAMTFFRYSRVIMEPSDGDMTKAFLGSGGVINEPNARNEGDVRLAFVDGQLLVMRVDGLDVAAHGSTSTTVGMAVIVSRQSGEIWQRSSERILLVPSGVAGGTDTDYLTSYLGDAILSFMRATESSLYLNQAESGF